MTILSNGNDSLKPQRTIGLRSRWIGKSSPQCLYGSCIIEIPLVGNEMFDSIFSSFPFNSFHSVHMVSPGKFYFNYFSSTDSPVVDSCQWHSTGPYYWGAPVPILQNFKPVIYERQFISNYFRYVINPPTTNAELYLENGKFINHLQLGSRNPCEVLLIRIITPPGLAQCKWTKQWLTIFQFCHSN